ncbi:Spy/CpxP family protein refolding chaperone [Ottowia sp.]|uniref:Spy/CpxP family protein refolding chaperone n=1 Tax=Ottowia sp. TaxID=1898956 RepID=UPI0039E3B977
MTHTPRRLLLGALLATSSAIALAQTPPPPPAGTPPAGEASARPVAGKRHDRMDPAQRQQRMAEHRARRLAELKARLKLTPAQEGAWASFTAALQPPAQPARPPLQRGEFAKLTTPQRIDLMAQRQAERATRMQQRGDATKAFYAQLTPEQQKTFDEQAMRHGPREGRGGPGHGKGHRHGPA